MGLFRDWFGAAEVVAALPPPETAPEPSINVRESSVAVPPARPSEAVLTPESALTIGAVYRSVAILTSSVAQMRLSAYRGAVEVERTPALVKTPDIDGTQSGFIEETVYSLAVYGNAYWRIYGDPVASVKVLAPADMTVTEDRDGRPQYNYRGKNIPASQIKHLKLIRRPGQLLGIGPIQAAASELGVALRLREFGEQWFNARTTPDGVLSTDMVLSPEESAAYAQAWQDFLHNNNGVAVLSQGLNYEALSLKPAEAQYVEVQNASVISIARLFGIPANYMLAGVDGSSATYQNLQELNLIFLQTTLTQYMNEIETALSSLLPRTTEVRFKQDDLLRMNSKVRAEIDVAYVEAGIRTADEIRERDGLSPLPPKVAPGTPPADPVPPKEADESDDG